MTAVNLLLLAAEAALASVILPLLAGLLARAYPRNAAGRRLVWVTMFAVLLALPLAATLSPTLAVITLHRPAVAATHLVVAPQRLDSQAIALMLGFYAWAVGVLWIVGHSLMGAVRLHRLKRGAEPVSPERLPLPLTRGCRALLAPECAGPMTWGVLRPVILLPDDALGWEASKLEAALRHELAHVRRKDSMIQALALLACALYWPNPLVWRAAHALRREAEAAADDTVLASGMRPSDYAGLLLDLASHWGEPRRSDLEMAMASPPILSERVQSILSPDALRTGAAPMDTFKLALVGGAALAALALARPSVAEITEPPSAPAGQEAQKPFVAPPASVAAAAKAAPGTTIQVPYNPVTDDPASPGYIPAGKPGASHPVSAELAKRLNARRDPSAPWDLKWIPNPNGSVPPAPGAAPAPALPAAPPAAAVAPAASRTKISIRLQDAGVGARQGPGGQETALSPDQRAELNRRVAEIDPKLQKALKDARIEEAVSKAIKDAHIEDTVTKAIKEARASGIVAHGRFDLGVDQGQDAPKP
jgi:beta-lactamase regulating signal transducer with metallopeptidase domain